MDWLMTDGLKAALIGGTAGLGFAVTFIALPLLVSKWLRRRVRNGRS